jgi:S1-C subfamily serine protease
MASSARLVFLTGSRAGTALELSESDVTIGRDPGRTVAFAQEEVLVSAEHATLRWRGGSYELIDEGSRNGTWVNSVSVHQCRLRHGDLIQFGAQGPTAQFLADEPAMAGTRTPRPTLESPGLASGAQRAVRSTREMMVVAYQRFAVRSRLLFGLAGAAVLGIGGVLWWQQRERNRLEIALASIAAALSDERQSRSALEQDLMLVEVRYDSLRREVLRGQERLASSRGTDLNTIRHYSRGVALIVFTYEYQTPDNSERLRYVVDDRGEVVTTPGVDGRLVPRTRIGGTGPAVRHHGTATGFLIDSAGWLLTNRHVAEPWLGSRELPMFQARGVPLQGRLVELRAYLPPGDQSFGVTVEAVSNQADIAVLRLLRRPAGVPVLPLATPSSMPKPGERLIYIGYPTGTFNLLFRVAPRERDEVMRLAGDDVGLLVEELARRHQIQPLIIDGAVTDTTALELVHSAATTAGASGGPLVDGQHHVVAVQNAILLSPTAGDPFRTQRGVPIRFGWEILPQAVREAARISASF